MHDPTTEECANLRPTRGTTKTTKGERQHLPCEKSRPKPPQERANTCLDKRTTETSKGDHTSSGGPQGLPERRGRRAGNSPMNYHEGRPPHEPLARGRILAAAGQAKKEKAVQASHPEGRSGGRAGQASHPEGRRGQGRPRTGATTPDRPPTGNPANMTDGTGLATRKATTHQLRAQTRRHCGEEGPPRGNTAHHHTQNTHKKATKNLRF